MNNPTSPNLVQHVDNTSFGKVILFLMMIGIGGVILGGLAYLVSGFIWIIIIFPILLGRAAAMLMAISMEAGKIRSVFAGFFFGLILGLLIYGSFHYFTYLQFHSELRQELTSRLEQAGQSTDSYSVEQTINDGMKRLTGQSGFMGYILFMDQEGVSIGKIGGSSQGANLGSALTWIYWAIELLIIVGGAIIGGVAASKSKPPQPAHV